MKTNYALYAVRILQFGQLGRADKHNTAPAVLAACPVTTSGSLRPQREAEYSPPSSATVMNAWSFFLFILRTLRTTLLLPLVLFFLLLYLNMLSAARIAQYNDWATCRTVQGSNSVMGKRSLHQGVYRVAGGVYWRVDSIRIHLVPTLRLCGVLPPLPLHSFVKLAKCGT